MRFQIRPVVTISILSWSCFSVPASDTLRISEISAGGYGASDWIEIHNRSESSINLAGHHLTDDQSNPVKWTFPESREARVPGKGYLVVFASGDTSPDAGLHTNFQLSKEGEFLALVAPDGASIIDGFSPRYPPQAAGVSWGMQEAGDGEKETRAYFPEPTPGAPNGRGKLGLAEPPEFSHRRGLHNEPFSLTLQSDPPGTRIRYTLDGTAPSSTTGTVYANPISVSTTTVVRAIAFKADFVPSEVATHSFVFPSEVAKQSKSPRGFPSDWGTDENVPGRVKADYEMDRRITENPIPGYSVEEALTHLPFLSIVLPTKDLFDPHTGIYTNPKNRGTRWERKTSVEYMPPSDQSEGTGFHVNAGLRIQGNSSRRPVRMQKHSFRLDFQGKYGVEKLRFPLFDGSPVTEFNKLVLRASSTDSWALVSWMPARYRPNDSQYTRDVWMKESHRAMGWLAGRSRYVHLYLNGLYWGIYNIAERLDEDFFADHVGGRPDEWDVIRDFNELGAGDFTHWNNVQRLAGSGASSNPDYEKFHSVLDVSNLADYMLLHFFADAEDWPKHNFYAARLRGPEGRFRFYVWDQEIILDNHEIDRYGDSSRGPGSLFQALRRNPNFRMLFADRANKHLSPGGALSLEACVERYRRISEQINKAIVAESARWGDTAASSPYGFPIMVPRKPDDVNDPNYPAPPTKPPCFFTREGSWLIERDNILTNYLPSLFNSRSEHHFLTKLRANDLYPTTDAPVLGRREGIFRDKMEVSITNPNSKGTVYFTLDGSDPRLPEDESSGLGLVSADAVKTVVMPKDGSMQRTANDWRQPDFDDSQWARGTGAAGYELRPGQIDYAPLLDKNLDFKKQVSPLNNECLFLRATFQLEDPGNIAKLTLKMRYDDGFVAYLNGKEVARDNAAGDPPAWNGGASASRRDPEAVNFFSFRVNDHERLLRKGKNVLAVHGLNQGTNSSDFLLHPVLEAKSVDSIPAGVSINANTYTAPLEIDQSCTVKTRVIRDGEWSALTEARYTRAVPANRTYLSISEIMYNPEIDENLEFIELENLSASETLDLSNVKLQEGVVFTFEKGTTIRPGTKIVVARNPRALSATHAEPIPIGGRYVGKLSNNGESIVLSAADGSEMERVTYSVEDPWPVKANGQGHSLEKIADPPKGSIGWQSSGETGGTPGR